MISISYNNLLHNSYTKRWKGPLMSILLRIGFCFLFAGLIGHQRTMNVVNLYAG